MISAMTNGTKQGIPSAKSLFRSEADKGQTHPELCRALTLVLGLKNSHGTIRLSDFGPIILRIYRRM